MLYVFYHATQFGQEETKTGSNLRAATDTVKKELDVLFDMSRGACASLEIAKYLELTAMEIAGMLKLVPGLVEDWKCSTAQGGARIALTLAKANYPKLSLDLVISGIPETYNDGTLVDEAAIRQSVLGYNPLCARGTHLNVYYKPHSLLGSPSGGECLLLSPTLLRLPMAGMALLSLRLTRKLMPTMFVEENNASFWPLSGFVI
jgi:hypothetical protein